MLVSLLALQAFHVLFLALHDWVPLGRLNDVRAVRGENPVGKLAMSTLVTTALFAAPLACCLMRGTSRYPLWLWIWLWCSYLLLFRGEIKAWWWPYFHGATPERQARYGKMFGRTHAFLPMRNGIVPNTLHVVLHGATLATLILLGALTVSR